jgi:hypothetical protein
LAHSNRKRLLFLSKQQTHIYKALEQLVPLSRWESPVDTRFVSRPMSIPLFVFSAYSQWLLGISFKSKAPCVDHAIHDISLKSLQMRTDGHGVAILDRVSFDPDRP